MISAVLCAAVLAGSAAAAAWPDWAQDAEDWARQHALGESFMQAPSAKLTRGQTAQLLYEAAGQPTVSTASPFDDVPASYADAATWAAAQGYVQGMGNGLFEPNRSVTREQFALMLYRQADEPAAVENVLDGFADGGAVSGWAQNAVGWAVQQGLIQGRDTGLLAPQDGVTTVEAVLILQRAEQPATPGGNVVRITDADALAAQLEQAIKAIDQPPVFDISAFSDAGNAEMVTLNTYYALLSTHPEYKYAYDLQAAVGADGLLRCTFFYMPYRTGDYPAGFDGITVNSLVTLMQAARDNLTRQSIPIRIINQALTVDDMNQALQQVGGSYLLCALNRDGTAITITPQNNLSHAAALDRLEEMETLADAIYTQAVKPGMDVSEQALALYTWLTDHVRYDRRYYSDPANLPYDATTAYGALHDQLAICGGYAQALQMLFERAGIPCWTVSGQANGENHMWNIAYLDGQWCYFDATSDRGCSAFGFRYFGVSADALTRYTWDCDWVSRLTD